MDLVNLMGTPLTLICAKPLPESEAQVSWVIEVAALAADERGRFQGQTTLDEVTGASSRHQARGTRHRHRTVT
jgi:hypothetical protein